MRTGTRVALVLVAAVGITACGGDSGGSPSSPSTTPTTPAPTNRAPVISNITISPSWGVSQLTTFNYSASASDPDNDALTYTWDIGGVSRGGSSGSITFTGGGTGTFRLTVTDGKTGSTTDSRTVTVGSMTGRWVGSGVSLGSFSMQLNQAMGVVTGTYSDAEGSGGTPSDLPGSINSSGVLVLRIKQAPYRDWTFSGQMDQGGRRITGTMQGSGFNGQAFYMDKQ
jgi:PKD domain